MCGYYSNTPNAVSHNKNNNYEKENGMTEKEGGKLSLPQQRQRRSQRLLEQAALAAAYSHLYHAKMN